MFGGRKQAPCEECGKPTWYGTGPKSSRKRSMPVPICFGCAKKHLKENEEDYKRQTEKLK